MCIMFVMVDYDSRNELGLASDEMVLRWLNRKVSEKFIEHTICTVKHRVIIRERK